MKAKILILAVVFLLVINIAFAYSIDVNLTKAKYGPQRSLEGFITLNVSNLPINSKLVFELNNLKLEKDLKNTCLSKKDASYSLVQAGLSSADIIFDSAGINTDYALDINTFAYIAPSAVSVDASIKLTGSPNTISPSLDINADNSAEWEYVGPLISPKQYIEVPPEYLYDLNPENQIYISGMAKDEYCENITLPLSQSYKINAYVKTINPKGKLKARIRTTNGYITDSNGAKAECTIEDTSSPGNYAWKSCEINNENLKFIKKQNQNYLICVYSDAATNTPYYYIAFQGASAINRGYKCAGTSCTYSNDLDYFITGSYGDYQKEFNTNVILTDIFRNNINNCKNSYKDSNYVHCLYPLKFSSKSIGKLTLSDISIIYNQVPFTKLSKISYVPELFTCTDKNDYYFDSTDLGLTDVITPKNSGDYTLTVKLKDSEKVYASDSADLKVIPVPSIVLNIPKQISLNIPIIFNVSVSGNGPFNYSWEFGDGAISTERSPSHIYKDLGTNEILLTVTDRNGFSESANKTIEVVSVFDTLSSMLNTTRNSVNNISDVLNKATGTSADAIEILKLKEIINNINFNLTKVESEFKLSVQSTTKSADAKEQDYSNILQNLLAQRASIPSSINIDSVSYESKLNNYNEIPDELFSGENINKDGVFSLQNQLNVQSDAYSISITYLSGTKEDFRLVKKQITVSGDTKDLYIIEYIPKTAIQSIIDKNILTPGFTIVQADPIIKWPAGNMEIVYRLDSGSLDSLTDTKTFLFSGEVKAQTFQNEPVCGDKICSPLEEGWCSDCQAKYPWLFFIFIFLIVAGGVYYINFYKGKYNFKEVMNILSVKLTKKRLFTNEKDIINLERYVKTSLNNNIKEDKIRLILINKGWTKKQIDYVFNKISKK